MYMTCTMSAVHWMNSPSHRGDVQTVCGFPASQRSFDKRRRVFNTFRRLHMYSLHRNSVDCFKTLPLVSNYVHTVHNTEPLHRYFITNNAVCRDIVAFLRLPITAHARAACT